MSAKIIGIAGGSSSGKTELARELARRLPGAAVVTLDSYYRGAPHLPLEERGKVNYDEPGALDWELLRSHLQEIVAGRGFDEPVYSFPTHTRSAETKRIEPADYLILEGLFVLYWPELRDLLDVRVYVDTDPAVCFERRLRRDVAERGRTPESVREQYEATVRPGAERFVYPTRAFAEVVVSGEQPLTESASAVLRAIRGRAAAG